MVNGPQQVFVPCRGKKNSLKKRPIFRTDLLIRTMFGFLLTHPPNPKCEHLRQEKYVHFGTSILKIYLLTVRKFVWH